MAKKKSDRSKSAYEVLKKVNAAIDSKRFFISVTSFDPVENRLDHFYATERFPEGEVFPSLKRIGSMFSEKSMRVVDDDSKDNS